MFLPTDIYSAKFAELKGSKQKETLFDFIRSAPVDIAYQAFLDIDSLPTPKDFVLLPRREAEETIKKVDRLARLAGIVFLTRLASTVFQPED
jgi:hypothetical protein